MTLINQIVFYKNAFLSVSFMQKSNSHIIDKGKNIMKSFIYIWHPLSRRPNMNNPTTNNLSKTIKKGLCEKKNVHYTDHFLQFFPPPWILGARKGFTCITWGG